ncbi:MAG: replicative DNA helicase [Flavobacteriales bacterium]
MNAPLVKFKELHNHAMEQAVLAALMSIDAAFDMVSAELSDAVFDRLAHREVYRAINALASAAKPYDAVMVMDWLSTANRLDAAGGEKYLTQILAESPASLYNLPEYAKLIIDLYQRRQGVALLNQSIDAITNGRETTAAESLSGAASALIQATATNSTTDTLKTAQQSVVSMMAAISGGNGLSGTPTGFLELDAKIGGLAGGQMIVIAGRPAMGKSLLASNLAVELMTSAGLPALFFSMEMSSDDLTQRIIANKASVPLSAIRSREWDSNQWLALKASMDVWGKAPFYIDDKPNRTPEQIQAVARRVHRENGGLACVVVDYMQLMRCPSVTQNRGSRTNEIDEISRSMKALAKEMNCPVLALSQLNRGLESRPNKRPVMSDLRESGAIEQDADLILFIYRDEVYRQDSPAKGYAEIIIGKQRQGPLGTVPLVFKGHFARFENPMGDVPEFGEQE